MKLLDWLLPKQNSKSNRRHASRPIAFEPLEDRNLLAAPTALNDAYTTNENESLVVAAAGVLLNDSDADSDSLSAVLDIGTTHGSLTLNADGSYEYLPDSDFFGTDSFTYSVDDGTSGDEIKLSASNAFSVYSGFGRNVSIDRDFEPALALWERQSRSAPITSDQDELLASRPVVSSPPLTKGRQGGVALSVELVDSLFADPNKWDDLSTIHAFLVPVPVLLWSQRTKSKNGKRG